MKTQLSKTKLGNTGLDTPRLALGCMGMSAFYTSGRGSEQQSTECIKYAISNGIPLDTAQIYGDNEAFVGKALQGIERSSYILW